MGLEHAGFSWDVPDRFNFVRDVVEPLAANRSRGALTFVDRTGLVQRLTFAELSRRRRPLGAAPADAGVRSG